MKGNNPDDLSTEDSNFGLARTILSITLHEGIPGHHYEINYHINRNVGDFFKTFHYEFH